MGSSLSTAVEGERDHVVVVGGGYGGLLLAHLLHQQPNKFRVTLIDPKDSMIHYVAALRSSLEPEYAKKMFIPYKKVLGESFRRGKVVSVDTSKKSVKLDNGEELMYTVLVIATGASSPFPGKPIAAKEDLSADEGIQMYKDFNQEIVKSKKIVIVGGGAVGLEMAGELRTDLPNDVQITMINSRGYLVSPRLGKPFQDRLNSTLERMKIEVISKDRVSNLKDLQLNKHVPELQTVVLASGKKIEADLVVSCIGNKLQTDFLRPSLGESMSEESGAISVNEYLQVTSHDDVYAIGDVNNVDEEKMAYTAKLHAKFLVQHLCLKREGKTPKAYKPADFIMVIPLGRNGGISLLMGFIVGDFFTKMLKSRGLFTSSTWKDVGLKAP